MSTGAASLQKGSAIARSHESTRSRLRAYFASDPARTTQTVLGLVWLLDGGLQFQSFMYSKGFISLLQMGAVGQPGWLHDSIMWTAKIASHNLDLYNTLFGLTQVAIGLLLLYRPTVKLGILGSLAWALVVWWFGEAFGMLFMNMAMPLTGAPGAVLLYGAIGLMAWPNGRAGGLFGVRGARAFWAVLWGLMAWLWLTGPSSSANATHDAINAAPSGMSWLSSVQDGFASVSKGNGLIIAIVFAAASAAIAIAVARNWRAKEFIWLAAAISLLYWVVGQGFGGIFAGGATDPNSGPLLLLLAYVLYKLIPFETRKESFDAPTS
jgi:hypothetical protein